MIAPGAGVAMVSRSLLGQSVGLADRRIKVDGEWRVAGSGPSRPGSGQQLAAHPVQLADVAPAKAAQEGAQGGGRLDHTAQGAGCPAGAQHVGIVDAVAARQRRGDQRHYLVASVGPPRRAAEVEVMVDEFPQAQVLGEGGRQEQAGIGHQAAVVKDDADTVGIVLCGCIFWVLLVSGRFSVPKPLSQIHRSIFSPFQEASHTPPFGGFGFRGESESPY